MSGDPYYILLQTVLDQLAGLLEPLEGWGKNQTGALGNAGPKVTVGYGLYINNPSGSDALKAALDALTENVVVPINGVNQPFSGNVFQIASNIASARSQSPPQTATIVASFANILSLFPANPSAMDLQNLKTNLANALTDWMTGNPLGSGGTPLPPPAGVDSIPFVLTTAEAEIGLFDYINGGTISESLAGSLSINGESPNTAGTPTSGIMTGYNQEATVLGNSTLSAGSSIPGLDPASAQWQAIIAAQYLGIVKNSNYFIGKAIALGESAQVWYLLRDVASQPTVDTKGQAARDYIESEMFGLNGGQTGTSEALALQDYEVLTEHRGVILPFEDLFGTDPDGQDPNTATQQIAVANRFPNAFPAFAYGPQRGLPPTASELTLAQEFDSSASQIIQGLNSSYGQVLPLIQLDSQGGADNTTNPFNVRSTDIYVAPTQADISAGLDAGGQLVASAKIGDPGPNGETQSNRNHILIGSGTGDTLVGGNGNDILIAGGGAESLVAGAGSDTLIGGQGLSTTFGAAGSDTLVGGAGVDAFDFSIPASGTVTETIVPGSNGSGLIKINDGTSVTLLGGSNPSQLLYEGRTAYLEDWSASAILYSRSMTWGVALMLIC